MDWFAVIFFEQQSQQQWERKTSNKHQYLVTQISLIDKTKIFVNFLVFNS